MQDSWIAPPPKKILSDMLVREGENFACPFLMKKKCIYRKDAKNSDVTNKHAA